MKAEEAALMMTEKDANGFCSKTIRLNTDYQVYLGATVYAGQGNMKM